MNIYTDLAHAKDELRRAKDHEQTIRAIAEYVELTGKNADDRKRELAFVLSQDAGYRKAQDALRDAEMAVDVTQAAIDQAETERREREWLIRLRLADALQRQHVESEDGVSDAMADRRAQVIGEWKAGNRYSAQREMDELYK